MGGDGGVIASQRKFVRGSKDPDKVEETKSIRQQQEMKSRSCSQSSERLSEPIVCCELGYLYNKEAILTALLEKSLHPKFSHIRGLKDVKVLKLLPNPNYCAADELDGELHSMFLCPITNVEFNGAQPFVAIWPTGFVLSEKAVREIGIEALQADYGPFSADDIIKLIPLEDEFDSQVSKMVTRRSANKKDKSKKRTTENSNSGSNEIVKVDADGNNVEESERKKSRVLKESESDSNKHAKRVTNLSSSSRTVQSAVDTISGQESSSNVYKKLFHKDHEKDKHDRDLFMSVSGLRYTIS